MNFIYEQHIFLYFFILHDLLITKLQFYESLTVLLILMWALRPLCLFNKKNSLTFNKTIYVVDDIFPITIIVFLCNIKCFASKR